MYTRLINLSLTVLLVVGMMAAIGMAKVSENSSPKYSAGIRIRLPLSDIWESIPWPVHWGERTYDLGLLPSTAPWNNDIKESDLYTATYECSYFGLFWATMTYLLRKNETGSLMSLH